MIKNTAINREALAAQVVESMDIDDLIEAMTDRLIEDYKFNDGVFEDDVEAQDFEGV
jgi:hypothetical protein